MRLDNRFALFDADGGAALLLSDYRRTIRCAAPEADLASVFAAFEAAAAQGEWLAIVADYELGACFEPVLAAPAAPRLSAWVFGQARQLDAQGVADFIDERLAVLAEHDRVVGVAEVAAALDAPQHRRRVERVQRWIADGDCYQINLTFALDCQVYGHPLALYRRLRERQPVRYGAYLATDERAVLSFSPELFFERRGSRVLTRPMKGTAARGATQQEDLLQRSQLLASPKERAENVMIVDLLRNDLGRLAAPGRVRVDSLCDAEAYPTLWQMVSTVSADLPGATLFDLFRALFPCGSITGAPKIRAMQCISELEVAPRGLYTGTLGWLAPGGDCRFNVAIRTLEVRPDGRARLGVGSGIVIDAVAEREYAECLLKASFITGFDPGFELIETLRLEGGAYQLLALHLERLLASARALGFACELPPIAAALAEQALAGGAGIYRVRLALAHDGRYGIDRTPMVDERGPWSVVLADERLDAGDYLLRHKTSARSRYQRALAALAGESGVFDAIFLNTRGEVCEGARSTVFIERDGILLTPPLACGLLPGVLRRQLIESGRAVEAVLTLADLLGASAIHMGNALRGLLAVTLRV
jgi:para-aminobenzoate synthetase/4-amino-4-deoxychorismate lyase